MKKKKMLFKWKKLNKKFSKFKNPLFLKKIKLVKTMIKTSADT